MKIDLKFQETGVRRSIIRYSARQYRCRKCGTIFRPAGFPTGRSLYGDGLAMWCTYQNMVSMQNMWQVRAGLRDLFGLNIQQRMLYTFKREIVDRYRPLYKEILAGIVAGQLLHIDETKVTIRGADAYVWVITSFDKVYFVLRDSRHGAFLKDMLKGFAGVLVSDFFTAYDSIDVPQQKCLLHLIRDMNDALLHNPFDEDFKMIVQDFSNIMKEIVSTVDRVGLRRAHLQRHKKKAEMFLAATASRRVVSEVALQFQKRIGKNGMKLFTFLDYDDVPWNNSNAECAIKRFAKYRAFTDGLYTKRSLEEALVLLSVFQTCEFSGVNVLRFMLSGQCSLDGILNWEVNRRRTKAALVALRDCVPEPGE